MKKLFLALMLIIGVGSFADDIELWKKSTLNKIIQKGEIVVAMDPGYMPFQMRDKQGNMIGFDVDLANEIAKAMGVKLKIEAVAFDGILAGLLTGKYDIVISGMTITQERNLQVNFSNMYVSVGQTLLVHKKHAGKKWKDLDKVDITLTAKLGQTGEFTAKRMFKNAKVRTFETESDAVQEVLNGNADAFVNDKPFNAVFMAEKGKDLLVHFDEDLTYEPLGWAVRKGDPDFTNWLNNFLIQIKGDGRFERIYNKWFNDNAWLRRVQ